MFDKDTAIRFQSFVSHMRRTGRDGLCPVRRRGYLTMMVKPRFTMRQAPSDATDSFPTTSPHGATQKSVTPPILLHQLGQTLAYTFFDGIMCVAITFSD